MSIKGFQINGTTQKYDYNALDNKPVIPAGSGVSEELKQALLQMAQKVAYIDAQGQTYYQALYDALYSEAVLTSITAAYSQSGTVHTTDTLDSLKTDLTVTAHYDDGTSEVVTNYTLSGNLTVGTSIITVSYGGKTDTFNVTVTRVANTFSISNNLTGCSSSNSATTVAENAAYNATITANTGYTLTGATVSITMGGSSVTGYYSNGTISIPNVTGDVVITVVATAVTLSSISAVFNQGSAVIYDTDSLNTLKQYLVVTATYSNSSTATVPSADYSLSGTLTAGTSTITVTYSGKTTTFTVTVTHDQGRSDMNGWTDGVAYQNLEIIENSYYRKNIGDIRTSTGWNRTGYVPCDGASSIVFPACPFESAYKPEYNCFFDENNGFISSFTLSETDPTTISVPANASYFGISGEANGLASCVNAGIVPYA